MATTKPDPYAAFLRALRRTPRDWEVWPDGKIRRRVVRMTECPLVAVMPDDLDDRGAVAAVIGAADNQPGHDPRLRARLLRACGLREAKR